MSQHKLSVPRHQTADELRETLADLRRLVTALDRRVPHPERDTEADIASDAAEIRAKALDLIRKLDEPAS